MNRTEDKLFENDFYKVLESKVKNVKAELKNVKGLEEIEIKSKEADKIFRNVKIAVKFDGDEDFKPEIEKPLYARRDALDYYPQSKMFKIRNGVYKVVLESTLWYMLYMSKTEYNKDKKTTMSKQTGFVFDLVRAVPSKEIDNPNKILPKGRYRVIEDRGSVVKIEEVEVGGRGGKVYPISKKLLDSLIQISKEGSVEVKAAEEITAKILADMVRKELEHIFGGRNFYVKADYEKDSKYGRSNEGSIVVSYASLPKGTKEIIENSWNKTQIWIWGFKGDGTLIKPNQVKTDVSRAAFYNAPNFSSTNPNIKKMRNVKGDPIKVAKRIIDWFKKNKDELLKYNVKDIKSGR